MITLKQERSFLLQKSILATCFGKSRSVISWLRRTKPAFFFFCFCFCWFCLVRSFSWGPRNIIFAEIIIFKMEFENFRVSGEEFKIFKIKFKSQVLFLLLFFFYFLYFLFRSEVRVFECLSFLYIFHFVTDTINSSRTL